MSSKANGNNCKWPTVADLEEDAIKIENNLEVINKHFIKKMLKVLNSIMKIIEGKQEEIFKVLLKWFRLYLKLHLFINPDDKKLITFYEATVPTIITYIIGCLQYNPIAVPNYHYNLLEILEELIDSVQPSVLNKITTFEKETIGCLWNPIEQAGDFNTQLKALKMFSLLLRQFDENRQNEELKTVKWTNLNLFQDKLKTIVQETKVSHVLANHSRELLNNLNMNLSKTVLVYSFYCETVTLGKKYRFYKPLNLQKFWVDINYRPKTLSYCGRFKINSNSKYEIINLVLKIQEIKLVNNTLQVYFLEPGAFSNYSDDFSNIGENVVEFTLTEEEKRRFINNNYVIEHFNNLSKSNSLKYSKTERTFDLLKNDVSKIIKENKSKKPINNSRAKLFKNYNNEMNTPLQENKSSTLSLCDGIKKDIIDDSSSKMCPNIAKEIEKRPKRTLRNKNKFFKSYLMDESFEDFENEKSKRKRSQGRKSKQTKSRCKQVCKVIPTVDLTKSENMEPITQNENRHHENNVKTQRKEVGLQQVTDIYDIGDTSYTKPCQSYRNFQTQLDPVQKTTNTKIKNRKNKSHVEKESSVGKKRKFNSQENKENVSPQTLNTADKFSSSLKSKSVISPHLFETQDSDEIPPLKKFNDDVSKENSLTNSSLECEEVRCISENIINGFNHVYIPNKNLNGFCSNVTTPRPTSAMNMSNLSDSDMEITQVYNCQNQQNQQIFQKNTTISRNEMEVDVENVTDLQNHCKIPIDETSSALIANNVANTVQNERNYNRDCIIFENREEEASSSDEDSRYAETDCNMMKSKNENISIAQENMSCFNQNLCHEKELCTMPDNNFKISTNITTKTATKCQVTPTAIIMHKLQVSAQKSVIYKFKESKKNHSRANKCLTDLFTNKDDTKLVDIQREILAFDALHLKTFNQINCSVSHHENTPNHTNLVETLNEDTASCALEDRQSSQNDSITFNNKSNDNDIDQQSSLPKDSQTTAELNIPRQSAALGSLQSTFRNELFRIIKDFNANTKQLVGNVISQGLKNISDTYAQHYLNITKAVLRKSEQNRKELEEIRSAIGRLVRELEWQYDAFINKSKEFDIHRDMCKRVLESITTPGVPNFINHDYQEIIEKISAEQDVAIQKVLQKYLKNNKL